MSEATAVTAVRPDAAGAVVEAHEITRRYGQGETAVDALRGVALDVAQGKLTAIMGPSGSGKSTLMHILAALDRPTSGYVTIAGTRLGQLNDNELTKLRREHIGFVFQFFNLLPMLTADENMLLPLSIAGAQARQGLLRRPARSKVGLHDRRSHRPVRALRRPAAARRDRARARHAADRRLRRRADRQPRLEDGRRDPRAARSSRSPTTARRSSWSRTTPAPPRSPTASSSSPTA